MARDALMPPVTSDGELDVITNCCNVPPYRDSPRIPFLEGIREQRRRLRLVEEFQPFAWGAGPSACLGDQTQPPRPEQFSTRGELGGESDILIVIP